MTAAVELQRDIRSRLVSEWRELESLLREANVSDEIVVDVASLIHRLARPGSVVLGETALDIRHVFIELGLHIRRHADLQRRVKVLSTLVRELEKVELEVAR